MLSSRNLVWAPPMVGRRLSALPPNPAARIDLLADQHKIAAYAVKKLHCSMRRTGKTGGDDDGAM